MAPTAAMKTAMKTASKAPMKAPAKAVIKTAMKVKASASSSSKYLCQGSTVAEKNKMTREALQNLGKFSLEDKVKKAIEDNEGNPEAAASDLKSSLTKLEHSKIWGQRQTFLRNNPQEAKEEIEEAGKKTKGLAMALWFIQSKVN